MRVVEQVGGLGDRRERQPEVLAAGHQRVPIEPSERRGDDGVVVRVGGIVHPRQVAQDDGPLFHTVDQSADLAGLDERGDPFVTAYRSDFINLSLKRDWLERPVQPQLEHPVGVALVADEGGNQNAGVDDRPHPSGWAGLAGSP